MSAIPRKVSVVIVVKNDRGIAATLDAIYRSPGGEKFTFETIVVDSSLPDRLADIRAQYPQVIWDQFPFSTRRTVPEQRNRGLALAQGDIIVFIDANCVPTAGWLEAIASTLNDGESIVCGPVHDLNKTNLVHYHQQATAGHYVDECATINVGFKRDVLNQIGGFDTSFAFGQDVDFFWRARDAGYAIYFNPSVVVAHDWGKPKGQLKRAYEYGKARAHLFKKHWRTRRGQLLHEPHVWVYPFFILGLPLSVIMPLYPLLLLIPILKNRRSNPFGLVVHHLSYGWGVLAGTVKIWPKGDHAIAAERRAEALQVL